MPDGMILPGLRFGGSAQRVLDPTDTINCDLVAFWPLDETNTQAAEDIGSRRWRLSSVTWPTRTVGARGRATNFAGASGQYLQNTSFVWPGGASAAISVWINAPGSYAGSPWDFGNGRSLASGNAFYGHLPFSDNVAYFYYGATGSGEISTSLAAHLNQWTHVAWAVRPGRKAIWINGRLAAESGTVSAAVAAGTNAYVGFSNASSMFHQGAMRLFRLRAQAWTDAEVKRLYEDEWAGTISPAERLFHAVRRIPPPPEPSITATASFSSLHGTLIRRRRTRTWEDVPVELAPVVSLAENYSEELAVQRAVDDALARYAALKARASLARRERLVDDLKAAIIHAVERAAEQDDEDALAALL
jgi:hypothetical protein